MSESYLEASFFPLLPIHPLRDKEVTPSSSSLSSFPSTDQPSIPFKPPPLSSLHTPTSSALTASSLILPLSRSTNCLSPTHVSTSVSTSLDPSSLSMFDNVISSGCIIKSQQRGESDLSHSQLCSELAIILHQRPGFFLMKYGKYLGQQDLTYFDSIPQRNDFEVNFRVQKLREALGSSFKSRLKKVRNRRYEYMRQLTDRSEYFSKEEMRQRNPLLYDFYIGQYLTDEDKQRDEKVYTDMSLSSMILSRMEQDRTAQLLKKQRISELDQLLLEKTEREELFSSSDRKATSCGSDCSKNRYLRAMELNSDPAKAEREKYMLQQEFLAAMQANFLDGKDEGFDYSKIDTDEQYDSLDMRERDEEDGYFDEEEPSWCEVEDEADLHSCDEADFNMKRMELDSEAQTYFD